MQHEIHVLLIILKYFNNTLRENVLDNSQIALAETIDLSVTYLENKIDSKMQQLSICNNKDYQELDKLLAELYFVVWQYCLDIERFGTLWLAMSRNYQSNGPIDEKNQIKFVNLSIEVEENDIFKKILVDVCRLNLLNGKKINYKNELDELKNSIGLYPKIKNKLIFLIYELTNNSNKETKKNSLNLIYVRAKLQDYLCILEHIKEALRKLAIAYGDKAERMGAK